MKNKILTAVSTVMMLIPWTILYLRTFGWALQAPAAEILISCYAAFMIFSGVFTGLAYSRAGVKNSWMKVCLVVNVLYAAGGVVAFGLMVLPKLV